MELPHSHLLLSSIIGGFLLTPTTIFRHMVSLRLITALRPPIVSIVSMRTSAVGVGNGLTKKAIPAVTASGPTELQFPENDQGAEVEVPVSEERPPTAPKTLTEERMLEILQEYDRKVEGREDAKSRALLDTLISQLTSKEASKQGIGTNLGQRQGQTGQMGGRLGGFSDILNMLRSFGIMGEESAGGMGGLTDSLFKQMYMQYHANADKIFLKGMARSLGVTVHDVEPEHS